MNDSLSDAMELYATTFSGEVQWHAVAAMVGPPLYVLFR